MSVLKPMAYHMCRESIICFDKVISHHIYVTGSTMSQFLFDFEYFGLQYSVSGFVGLCSFC